MTTELLRLAELCEQASGPHRVQLSRKKGWRMPPNTVKVDRSTRFGNPFAIGCNPAEFSADLPTTCDSIEEAIRLFRVGFVETWLALIPSWLDELRGKNLACWCPLDKPCHADVLLELANRKDSNHG